MQCTRIAENESKLCHGAHMGGLEQAGFTVAWEQNSKSMAPEHGVIMLAGCNCTRPPDALKQAYFAFLLTCYQLLHQLS